MLNKLGEFIRQYALIQPGDRVTCAVSGGADSIALLWGLYLLKDRLGITLAAAHFNHSLRGEESDQDEAFVRTFCKDYQIPCYVEKKQVIAGPKGLEAAAREARYNFFATLPGKIATAHTADDNAETVMMHLVRGTGLKGLGAIAPINGQVIRPMLSITRREVLAFLEEYHLQYVTDSSNETDAFLRNRIRHHVMPLLKQENPRLAENLSAMALRLRQDEAALAQAPEYRVEVLRQMPQAMRLRAVAADLESWGVPEPEAAHLELVEKLILSDHPSARADLPGGITVCRNYGVLERYVPEERISPVVLKCPGQTVVEALGLRVICEESEDLTCGESYFTVSPRGEVIVRSRQSADRMRLSGGSKSLKKLFVDRKIPAAKRMAVPVIADDDGILGVYGIGVNLDRLEPGIRIRFESL
jgi:tRNA(Ile)-lysidine synthase